MFYLLAANLQSLYFSFVACALLIFQAANTHTHTAQIIRDTMLLRFVTSCNRRAPCQSTHVYKNFETGPTGFSCWASTCIRDFREPYGQQLLSNGTAALLLLAQTEKICMSFSNSSYDADIGKCIYFQLKINHVFLIKCLISCVCVVWFLNDKGPKLFISLLGKWVWVNLNLLPWN